MTLAHASSAAGQIDLFSTVFSSQPGIAYKESRIDTLLHGRQIYQLMLAFSSTADLHDYSDLFAATKPRSCYCSTGKGICLQGYPETSQVIVKIAKPSSLSLYTYFHQFLQTLWLATSPERDGSI